MNPLAWLRRQAKRPRWRHVMPEAVRALVPAPAGGVLVAADAAGHLAWCEPKAKRGQTLQAHQGGILALAWRPDGGLLATGGEDGSLALWGPDGAALGRLALGPWVEHLAATPQGLVVAQGARLSHLDWEAPERLSDWPEAGGGAVQALATQGGDLWVVRARGLQRWRWQSGGWSLAQSLEHPGLPLALATSPDGASLVVGNHDKTLTAYVAGGTDRLAMRGYRWPIRQLSWDATSRWLASGGNDSITVWDFSGEGPAGSRPVVLEAHPVPVTALAFQHARPRLASGDGDGWVFQWKPGLGTDLHGHHELGEAVSALAWSLDDRALWAGGLQGALAMWEAA